MLNSRMLLHNFYRRVAPLTFRRSIRFVSTLPNNPHIYVFPAPNSSHILSLLPTDPPTHKLSIGKTTEIPPNPDSFTENPEFLPILNSVLADYAVLDPQVQNQAAAFATTSSSGFRVESKFHAQKYNSRSSSGSVTRLDGSGEAEHHRVSSKPGGWLHISDARAPPDYGRIAWPEDIFGCVEVTGDGEFVDEGDGEKKGRFQASGTYRIVTREGILGLTDFLRGRLTERLIELERTIRGQ